MSQARLRSRMKAPGWYDGQWTISFTLSFGISYRDKIHVWKSDIGISLDIISYELINLSVNDDTNNPVELSYYGKNKRIKVSHGFNVNSFNVEQSFFVRLSDLEYIFGTTSTTISSALFDDKWKIDSMYDGAIDLSISYGSFLQATISITGNVYYESQNEQ